MIEATCSACGTVNRIAEADVPLGAKFVACSSCKSRVMLPASALSRAMTSKVPLIPAPAIPKIPAPAKPAELADLPAPKRQGPLAGMEASKSAPKSGLDLVDLPAPKGNAKGALDADGLPADLPAPKAGGPSGISDLPAPKAKPGLVPRVTPPKGVGISDLPAPKPKASPAGLDLPAPKPRAATPPAPLPAVREKQEIDIVDLPAPKGISDLPTPKTTGADLPAPKGFFDDLPQPARQKPGASDLPAPKGFFDDLPQPAKHATVPPPTPSADLPAPKGFFDDLPQPAKADAPAPPAPKGFFDDLPQPSKPATVPPPIQPPATPAAPVAAKPSAGVFDDLPEPMGGELSGTDLLGGFTGGDLDLGPSTGPALELDMGGGDHADLDLGLASPTSPGASPAPTGNRGDFADLDLSSPTAPPAPQIKTGISIKPTTAKSPAGKASPPPIETIPKSSSEIRLDLEDDPNRATAQPGLVTPKRRDAAKKQAAEVSAEAKQRSAKRRKIVLGAVLGLALVGSGGAFFYKRYTDKKAREEAVAEHVKAARAAIHGDNANHWTRASSEAGEALQSDPKNLDAIGLQAEALLGGALDTGIGGDARIAAGRKKLADALEAGVTGPQLEAAQALGMIASNQADRAIQKLQTMTQREPKNGFWLLYLGWAQAAKGDAAAAVKSFDAALAADPKVKLPVLYARGKAKLDLVDLAGAKADFAAVLELAKDHIGAQVGLDAALPASESSRREAELLGILARKDIGTGDPRAVVQAWTLAADVARTGGRLDVARERYHKALELAKLNVPALVGLARVELKDGKLAVAQDLVQKALTQAPEHVDALLVAADLDVAQGKLGDADAITKKLAARTPPLPPAQQAQLDLVTGNVLEAQGNEEAAIEAWTAGAKLAGDTDLAPMMAAVTKLGELAKKAADNRDPAKAADYRARADALLQSLADRAQEDAQLSKALGAAYLGSDDPVKAEHFLRRAVEMKTDDIESHLELAKALSKLNRIDDALEQLKAAQQLDPTRPDIALEIARTYEDAKRDDEASAAYKKLLDAKDPPIQARVRAGRFLARKKEIKAAAAQGDIILKAEPENAAGHYLKGEGLLAEGKLDDARKELTIAADGDPDPQYLDAQGRAAEASVAASGDTKYYDLALRAYERAIAAAPEMFNPQAGTGRIYIARREWTKAITPLLAANRIDKTDAEVMYDIGLAYKNMAQPKVAAEWLQQATTKKRDADTYYQLALLYLDANSGSAEGALREATHLAQEKETKQGVKVDWLTDAYYKLAQTEYGLHNLAGAKAAYESYLGRNPPPGAALDEARRLLSTELRGQ